MAVNFFEGQGSSENGQGSSKQEPVATGLANQNGNSFLLDAFIRARGETEECVKMLERVSANKPENLVAHEAVLKVTGVFDTVSKAVSKNLHRDPGPGLSIT